MRMMTTQNPHISRRTVFRTVAGTALAGLAGCLGDNDSGTPDNDTDPLDGQDQIERIAVEETTLFVELSAGAEVDQVNLIKPNGELFRQLEVATGARQVSFELRTSYAPGEYRVIGLKGEETMVEISHPIQPDLRIVEMGIGRNQPEQMWDGSSRAIAKEAFVSVENRGSGPDAVTKLLFTGDVPYPSDEDGTNYADHVGVSGIYDPNADVEAEEVIVGPKEQLTLYSYRSPFTFIRGEGTSCTAEEQTGEFNLSLETRVGSNISTTYTIYYSDSDEYDNCKITISEV